VSKTYPVDHTNDELNARAAELSQRILAYDRKTGNAEDLIKDSVLFNVTYIELQNRVAGRATGQMVLLTWASAFVAVASLGVAWLSYTAAQSGDEWQAKQLKLLAIIADQSRPAPQPSLANPSGVPAAVSPVNASSK
jgi:hypothetical protein